MDAMARGNEDIRDRIVSHLRTVKDRKTRELLTDILVRLDRPYDPSWVKKAYGISKAEYRVLSLIIEGKSPVAISEITGTQVSTIRTLIYRIYKKLNVSSMAELTALLLSHARNA